MQLASGTGFTCHFTVLGIVLSCGHLLTLSDSDNSHDLCTTQFFRKLWFTRVKNMRFMLINLFH